MIRPTRYREITVAGPPRELGRQLGEAARDEIRGFCEIAIDRVNRTISVSRSKAYDVARRSLEYAADYAPELVEELEGTSEGAGVSIDDLMLLQVRNQLQSEQDSGCTALSLPANPPRGVGRIVAQNWDNDPVLDEFTIVLTRQPEAAPAFMTCTQAGLISYLGFNSRGIGACLNALPAPSREVGVPHYFVLRKIHETASLDAATRAVRRAHRAIAANIMLTTPEGPADLEITPDAVHVLRPHGSTWLTHTNHCCHPELEKVNREFPELIQSHARLRRVNLLLSAGPSDYGVKCVRDILCDHEEHPTSICRHANDHSVFGFWETVFSIIIEPDALRMHVSRGTPCTRPYETYELKE